MTTPSEGPVNTEPMPCPHCGKEKMTILPQDTSPPGTMLILCTGCGASIGGHSLDAAVQSWNRRSSVPERGTTMKRGKSLPYPIEEDSPVPAPATAQAAEIEREECAKLAERFADVAANNAEETFAANRIATLIRERGQSPALASPEGSPASPLAMYGHAGGDSDDDTPGSEPEGPPPCKCGTALIAAERERQVQVEGWTPAHDDAHTRQELAAAAIIYIHYRNRGANFPTPLNWPWDRAWWKPSDDPIRNLVKAGALIAAEIDRLQRVPAPASGDTQP